MAREDARQQILPNNDDNVGFLTSFCCGLRNATVEKPLQLDDQNLDFGVCPFDEQGELLDRKLLEGPGYKNVSNSNVLYLDVCAPPNRGDNGVDGDIWKLQVSFNYNLSDESGKLVDCNKSKSGRRKTKEMDLMSHSFGKGFEEGITGMQEGGIRRIIVPVKEEGNNELLILFKDKDFAVFDLELLGIGISWGAWIRRHIFRRRN